MDKIDKLTLYLILCILMYISHQLNEIIKEIEADFKAGYKILDRTHVNITKDPYTDKPFIKFYAVKRVGGDVLDSRALKMLKV